MKKISILIADDHRLLRQGLALLLNSDPRFVVVGETGCGRHAVALAAALRPEVVILDVALPRLDGVEATRLIRQQAPRTRVLALSLSSQWGVGRRVLEQGGLGYVTKSSPSEELVTALLQVARDMRYVCREVRDRFSDGGGGAGYTTALTRREREVVAHVCRGASSREIASALQVSQKTVETHRYHILKKLGLNCTTALIGWVHKHGLERPTGRCADE